MTLILFAVFISVSFAQLPKPDHIVIVIEENHGYDQIIGNSSAAYINSLANDSLSALFTDSHGVTHPSQPNYLWFFSGNNQGVTSDNLPTDTPFTTLNLGYLLLDSSLTFAGYSEDLPYEGFSGGSSGAYKRKHNPWVNWQDAIPNGVPWNLNKPFSEFPSDYNNLPTVSFVIPNQNNDMHDGTVAEGDTWLHDNLDSYVQWAKTHNSLFILTFDEDDFTTANKIATIFIGEMVKDGNYDQKINHLNILKTIEDMYGLNYTGSSGDSTYISNCWIQNPTSISYHVQKINYFQLEQNYPNPFNPSTKINYNIAKSGFVTLNVFDELGNLVVTLINNYEIAGNHSIKFNASKFSSGIYFYRLEANGNVYTRKMILMK